VNGTSSFILFLTIAGSLDHRQWCLSLHDRTSRLLLYISTGLNYSRSREPQYCKMASSSPSALIRIFEIGYSLQMTSSAIHDQRPRTSTSCYQRRRRIGTCLCFLFPKLLNQLLSARYTAYNDEDKIFHLLNTLPFE